MIPEGLGNTGIELLTSSLKLKSTPVCYGVQPNCLYLLLKIRNFCIVLFFNVIF